MSFFKAESKKRLRQLDILRGVAVLLVIGHHVILQPEESGMFQPLVNVLIRFGWSGVDLFFVLSGFLVGGLLFSELRSRSVLDVRRFIIAHQGREAEKNAGKKDDERKHLAGANALANGSANKAAHDRSAKSNNDRNQQPERGDFVAIRFKGAIRAQSNVDAGEDRKVENEHDGVTRHYRQNGFQHFTKSDSRIFRLAPAQKDTHCSESWIKEAKPNGRLR